jgi:rhodanese-related sulfurtransferase
MDAEISAAEVHDLLEGDDPPVVVDIRNPPAYAQGHVPGSVNIPFSQLPARVAELEGAERIVTVCPHGQASVQAARLIGSYEGTGEARVESMAEGIEGWEWELETDVETAEADEGPQSPF